MTHSIPEQGAGTPPSADVGPDPVTGAGITLLGILVMGISGASDAHYAFDLGVLIAVGGAVTFVVCVALSALKQRHASEDVTEAEPKSSREPRTPQPGVDL